MWRCKTASGSSEDPYLTSLNGFVGRQQWVFDPDAGTAAERKEAERQRAYFAANRHEHKHASDEPYRRSCCSGRKARSLPRVPGAAIGETADVSEGDVRDALVAGTAYYSLLQVRAFGRCVCIVRRME